MIILAEVLSTCQGNLSNQMKNFPRHFWFVKNFGKQKSQKKKKCTFRDLANKNDLFIHEIKIRYILVWQFSGEKVSYKWLKSV